MYFQRKSEKAYISLKKCQKSCNTNVFNNEIAFLQNKADNSVFLKKDQKGHSEIFSHCIFSSFLIGILVARIEWRMKILLRCKIFDVELIHWVLKSKFWYFFQVDISGSEKRFMSLVTSSLDQWGRRFANRNW